MNQLLNRPQADRRVEAFVATEEGRDAVAALMQQAPNGDLATYHAGTLETFSRLSGLAEFGDIVLVEIGASLLDETIEILREVAVGGVQIILLGPEIDVPTYRAYLIAGAMDYIITPHRDGNPLPDLWRGATVLKNAHQTRGQSIAVCGVCGGVGASVFATNLAIALATKPKGRGETPTAESRVGLLDADLHFGPVAVELDMEMTMGVFDALTTPERVDATFLQATMQEVQPGLSVYSAEVEDPLVLARYEAGLGSLLRAFQEVFPASVVDLPRRFVLENHAILEDIDDLVLVLSPGFGAVRSAGRLLDGLARHNASQPRVWLVMSHMRRDAGLSAKEVADTLNRPLSLELPLCASDISRASVKGVPIQSLFPRSRYSRCVRQFSEELKRAPSVGGMTPTQRVSWWKKV
ncbi:AAA family ATPase [Thalassospira alkalitolerans]|uniref:AAA family ATPase n=1 Tax=Thalassospira alkalitolerans TaxID=1293890 RepID=UPI003AA84CF9